MKKLFVLAFFLYSGSFLANNSSIRLLLRNCSDSVITKPHESKVYKTIELKLFKEDSLIQILTTNSQYRNHFTNLKIGTYNIEYKGINGTIKKKTINIDSIKEYKLPFCSDSLFNEKKKVIPFIKKMKPGDSFTIKYDTYGCAHHYKDSITFYKKGEDFIILKHKKTSKKVTKRQLKQIINFESKIRVSKSKNLCTNSDIYELIYKNETFRTEDQTCRNYGYIELLYKLNLIKD